MMTDKTYVLLDDVIAHIASCERSNMLPVECSAITLIKNVPAADVVERKVGHWIFHPEQKNIYGGKLIECSKCKTQYLVMNVVEEIYCRHCGSKNQNGGQNDV